MVTPCELNDVVGCQRPWSRMVHAMAWWLMTPGPWFNMKITSCQYRKSHCVSSYLYNGIYYTGKMASFYWISHLAITSTSVDLSWYISETLWHLPEVMLQEIIMIPITKTYRQVSNIRHTIVGNSIADHSDVVGATPVGAAPIASSFSTEHLASIYCAKTTASRDEKHSSGVIWCVLY